MEFLGLTPLGLLGMSMMIVPAILVLRLRETSPGRYS